MGRDEVIISQVAYLLTRHDLITMSGLGGLGRIYIQSVFRLRLIFPWLGAHDLGIGSYVYLSTEHSWSEYAVHFLNKALK